MRPSRRSWCLLALLASAGLAACDVHSFTENPATGVEPLKLSTAGNVRSLPADGFSSLTITAEASGSGLKPNLSVRFRTTSGTFLGTTAAETPIDVALDSGGKAVAVLRSSTRTGTVVVSAQILEGTTAQPVVTQLELSFVVPDTEGLHFVGAATSAPADGATATRFTVQVPASLPLDQRTVAFKTSFGSFDGAVLRTTTVAAGADGRASLLLYSPADEGIAVLSATVGVFDVETVVVFDPAPAEQILVSAPAVLKEPQTDSDHFVVTATLVRRIGTATLGTVVSFEAFDGANKPLGNFHNVTLSNSAGVATAELRPQGTGTPGTCKVKVRAAGSTAVGTATFRLVRP